MNSKVALFIVYVASMAACDVWHPYTLVPLISTVEVMSVDGYAVLGVSLGHGSQVFHLVISTIYDTTYIPCAGCRLCGTRMNKYDPELSLTLQKLHCNDNCPCYLGQCSFTIQNAEMGIIGGTLIVDNMKLSNVSLPKKVRFGCATQVEDRVYQGISDGLLGLGKGPLNILQQIEDMNGQENIFSLCLGGKTENGSLILGRMPLPTGMRFTSSNPGRSPFYNIDLKEIIVGGEKLDVSPSVYDGLYGTIVDTGSRHTLFPAIVYDAFVEMILSTTKAELVESDGDDLPHSPCFKDFRSENIFASFPKVKLIMGGEDAFLEVHPANFLYPHPRIDKVFCLDIKNNAEDPTTIVGVNFLRDHLVTFDIPNQRIGFLKTKCSGNFFETDNNPQRVDSVTLMEKLKHIMTDSAIGVATFFTTIGIISSFCAIRAFYKKRCGSWPNQVKGVEIEVMERDDGELLEVEDYSISECEVNSESSLITQPELGW